MTWTLVRRSTASLGIMLYLMSHWHIIPVMWVAEMIYYDFDCTVLSTLETDFTKSLIPVMQTALAAEFFLVSAGSRGDILKNIRIDNEDLCPIYLKPSSEQT